MTPPGTTEKQGLARSAADFRRLGPNQSAQLWLLDIETGQSRLVVSSDRQLFEAPNWHPSGEWIVVNADGRLFRVATNGSAAALEPIHTEGLPALNNDHLVSPDGGFHYVSAQDGHIWRLPWEGGSGVRITTSKDADRGFRHYLHGISPDGESIAFVGTEVLDELPAGRRALWVSNLRTGDETVVGSGYSPADGPEFSPDGEWLYFNSEINSTTPGHAQIFRRHLHSGQLDQLSFDEYVNWFPHVSPDGAYVAYLRFPVGTVGHPADRPVVICLVDLRTRQTLEVVHLRGDQGTLNVNSWSPDSKRIAFVAYPSI